MKFKFEYGQELKQSENTDQITSWEIVYQGFQVSAIINNTVFGN